MKSLFVSFLFVFLSFVSISQTYKFDVKSYNLHVVSGFSEKDAILKNSKMPTPMVCNRNYTVDMDNKLLLFYEDGVFVEKFTITDVIETNSETEMIVESYLTGNGNVTTFSIYYTLKNNEMSDICLFWYDPFNNKTLVKNVK
jgi:hypothetical protein